MMNWNFNAMDYNPDKKTLIEEGKHRVRISSVKQTVARNGTQGLDISLKVNGYEKELKHYIWFNRNNPARTNQLLGEFYNSFYIPIENQQNCDAWLGQEGAVYVVQDVYKGRPIAKVSYCIPWDKQEDIPAWKESQPVFNNTNIFNQPVVAPAVSVERDFGPFNF